MAELSGLWTTDAATPEGDQVASYTQAQLSTAFAIISACSGFEGVAPGYLNGLEGTVTGANTVAINTGGGMVDGKFFLNDASQDVNIPSSAGGTTRIDRIVLRATWASFNVSVTRIAGDDAGSPTAPAITQTSGTTYDIQLYQALVNSSGTVTLTDERTFASQGLIYRQGGSATIWNTTGTTNYQPGNTVIQVGAIDVATGAGVNVIFPRRFSYIPLVLVSIVGETGYNASVDTPIPTGFVAYHNSPSTEPVNWLAIGPAA